ncbi:hypothetical protein N7499_005587 [Penicillium canescens]|uniref:Zn(2)-C6 fungal-type domain-containing protein n=1 Tax=Penicillium canescens TaxID=5083 RepID=A0AAD6ID02_PENCN|nr:hypothetical protein N7522_009693 [Penicillium canescens]KAJ6043158.1 hypothetical protein N7460_004513 [Penicillium canescens]KAJ6054633.1 hypothetical protein N7444_003731 [Penicillium canescens]KAJ6080713.1 hypothetical protein N7499_005587 [Penicillium canescens]KAJ6177495.1 hypothetical protein N7485_004409 [Penicillium canescens]
MAEFTKSTLRGDQAQVKLRSACDRCSSNKVKCSQERPECQRCRSLNLPCQYSRSLRMGKPPRSRQRSSKACCHHDHDKALPRLNPSKPAAVAPATNPAVNSKPKLNDQLLSQANEALSTLVPSWSDDFDYESIMNDDNPTIQPLSPYFSDLLGDFTTIAPRHNHPPLPNCPNVLPDLSKAESISRMLESTLDGAIYEEGCTQHLSHQGNLESLTPTSLPGLTFPAKGSNSNNHHIIQTKVSTGQNPSSSSDHQCIRLAMETLDSLYQISSSAKSYDPGLNKPSVDHFLQVNGDAMEVAATILACPCVKDFCLLIILAIVPCKVLAGYQAVVNMPDPHIQVAAGEETVCRPIAVGAYMLDEKASRIVIIQLVLAKLRELSRFVQTYIDTFCFDASKNRQGHCGLVYRTLGLFIQSRLGTTMDGLQEKLSALVGEGKSEFK